MSKKNEPKPFVVKPDHQVHLKDIASDIEGLDYNKQSAYEKIADNAKVMADHARRLYAENRRSILLVLQGMDTAGKDGTIRTVMRGVNPRSCQVSSFKKPTEEELDHDFLWHSCTTLFRGGEISASLTALTTKTSW